MRDIEGLTSVPESEDRHERRRPRSGHAALVVGLLWAGLVGGVLLLAGWSVGRSDVPGVGVAAAASSQPGAVDTLLVRARVLTERLDGVELYYEQHVAPIERVLKDYRDDPVLDQRIAVSLVREANRAGLSPRLLLAVLLVENPALDPQARSAAGAVGLMQVMPMHRGGWAGCPDDLEGIDANICYGARIFAYYYHKEGDLERALLDYNGCVHGTNTPDCRRYPYRVYERAGRASLLAWLPSSRRQAPPDRGSQ